MAKYFFCLILLLLNPLVAQQRGLWIVRHSLSSVQDLERLVQIQQKIGLSDIYLQVRALGSNVYEQTADHPLSLDEMVRFCQLHGIRLHAWINVNYIWSSEQPPSGQNHPFRMDADHLMSNAQQDEPELQQLREKGVEGFFVDADAFANYQQVSALIKHLLLDKQLDGIHLDYLRYPGQGFIFSRYLRTKFMKKYYIDPRLYFSDLLPDLEGQKRYQNFLLNELNNLVENLRNVVKGFKQDAIFSVAVKPDLAAARTNYYQDWLHWLNNATCDQVLIMNYAPDDYVFNKNLIGAEKIAFSRKIICGIGAYYLDQKKLEQRINIVERSKLGGFALFSFTTIKEQPEILSLVKQR